MLSDTDDAEFLSLLESLVILQSFPPKQQIIVGTGKKKERKIKSKSFPRFSQGHLRFFFPIIRIMGSMRFPIS